jgi:hypothetical protein
VNLVVQGSLQFPTVVFTIALGIALVYWVFVLVGALDLDLFGGGDVDVSGAAKGIGDAILGAKGGAEGGVQALKGVKLASDDGGMWQGLGLGGVPVTISVSIIVLIGWCASLLSMHYLVPAITSASWLPAVLLPATLIGSLVVTGFIVRPLRPVFAVAEGKSNRDYIGHLCTITTGKVDEGFGQATIEDGGTVLVIAVRCDRSDRFARGDKALIIDFDAERQAYLVEPSGQEL